MKKKRRKSKTFQAAWGDLSQSVRVLMQIVDDMMRQALTPLIIRLNTLLKSLD